MIRVAIFFLLCILLVLVYVKFRNNKDLNKEITFVSILLLALILFFQYLNAKFQHKVTKLLIAYNKGQTLICKNAKVDKRSFDYESGTMVFISKKIVDIKYPILECKIK